MTVNSGATLNVNNSGSGRTVDINGSTCEVKNSGTINISGGTEGIYSSNSRWTNQSGGVTDISSFSSYGFYDSNGAYLTNNGTITIDGGSNGIRMTGGTLSNNSGGTLTVQNASNSGISVPASGEISNNGNLNVNNCGGTSLLATWIYNNGSGNISVTNAGNGIYPISEFTNSGSITITTATGYGIYLEDVTFSNSGSITISGTTGYAFDFDEDGGGYTFSNSGTLQGTGTFDMAGNALGGTIVPGTSPGTMTYPVSQTFSSTTMQFEVNGTTAGTQHDQIVVTGTATISGTLNASFGYGYQNGDRIVIISATTISGTFSSDNLLTDWSIDYSQAGEVALVYSGVSLPVELLSFDAELRDENVLLTWQTASELNNSHFEVEWSIDGEAFESIVEIAGSGTTSDVQFYDFLHERPRYGINYYRLRQVDFDDQFEYSTILSIKYDTQIPSVEIFPNPATDYIVISGAEPGDKVQIINMAGQIEREFQIQNTLQKVSINELINGIYFVKTKEYSFKILVN